MACPHNGIPLVEAILTCTLATVLYVGLLYLPFNHGPRDSSRIIVRRLISLTIFSLLFEYYLHQRLHFPSSSSPTLSTITAATTIRMTNTTTTTITTNQQRINAFFISTFLTLLLYIGHLFTLSFRLSSNSFSFQQQHQHQQLQQPQQSRNYALYVRNYIAAPFLEEIVFRRQSLLLWQCIPTQIINILFPALCFALAHVHHVRRLGLIPMLFQLAYTFLFGVYAAALYLNTGTVFAPYAAHVVCNVLELPDLNAIAVHPRAKLISGLYVLGIITFAIGFGPATTSVKPQISASV